MNSRQHRVIRLLATAGVAAGLVVPVSPAVAGSPERPNPILRNDIAHFGNDPAAAERQNAILRNDIAHFGVDSRQPSPSPAAVVVRVHGGFDWISAGVGLAGGLGLVLAIGVAASAVRARQRTHEARA